MQPAVVVEWNSGAVRSFVDELAGEEPLEVRVGGRSIALLMRTPGHDVELAAGFLLTEGVIEGLGELRRIASSADEEPGGSAVGAAPPGRARRNVVDVELVEGCTVPAEQFERHFAATSACGVCGRASIEAVRARVTPTTGGLRISAARLCRLPTLLRTAQRVFAQTGGLHAAALFDSAGELLVVREDIGRHNAVDKIIGWSLLHQTGALEECGLLVSGRGGFEIVQKAIAAGIPLVACISAPSSLAVQLARETGQTLVGFLRGTRFVVYAGEERIRHE